MSSKSLHAFPLWELFPLVRASERSCVQVRFSTKKNIVKERTTIERETYVQKGGWAQNERQREERAKGVEKGDAPYRLICAREGGGNVGENDQKRRAISGGCSLSPRIVRRCRCFSLFLYLVVPFPNFTLQIPLLTLTKVDAVVIHLANLLQLHYKEYGESLRNL